ncbi:hypothetical protein DY116_01780 [Apilactobacillus micheneri]|nr:hypothetical protein DY116_01780 [Apilactobacillus micheneri]
MLTFIIVNYFGDDDLNTNNVSMQETNYLLGNERNRKAILKSLKQLDNKDSKIITQQELIDNNN